MIGKNTNHNINCLWDGERGTPACQYYLYNAQLIVKCNNVLNSTQQITHSVTITLIQVTPHYQDIMKPNITAVKTTFSTDLATCSYAFTVRWHLLINKHIYSLSFFFGKQNRFGPFFQMPHTPAPWSSNLIHAIIIWLWVMLHKPFSITKNSETTAALEGVRWLKIIHIS